MDPAIGECDNLEMATTPDSLTQAAKKKAVSAREKARLAEGELVAANKDLSDAIEESSPKVKRAHSRTQVAEKAVSEAAQEMEVVEVLLDVAEGVASGPAVEGATDEGTKAPLKHLKPGEKASKD